MDNRGEGSIKSFRRNFFVPQSQTFPRGIFTVAVMSGTEKVWIRGGGEYQDFPSKHFCLTVPKSHVGESFTVALISGREKVYGTEEREDYQDFPLKFFCLTVPNIS